jgi:hypothetical protein
MGMLPSCCPLCDKEFPATIQLLFDKSVEGYLSLEDIVVVGEMATSRLIALGKVD